VADLRMFCTNLCKQKARAERGCCNLAALQQHVRRSVIEPIRVVNTTIRSCRASDRP
jgi:hypothetical protein